MIIKRTPTPSIKFPYIEDFSDYHEIDEFKDILNSFFEEEIEAIEIGNYQLPQCALRYLGLFFFQGERPTGAELYYLMEELELDIEHIEITTPFYSSLESNKEKNEIN